MIVKYCNQEHNAHRGAKLLVGNLEKYRDIENAELADSGEGTFQFTIEFLEGAELSAEWANLLFQGAIGFGEVRNAIRVPGGVTVHAEDLRIERVLADRVIFEHAKAQIQYSSPNAFVFCTSMSEGDPLSTCPFRGYDDYWNVGADQASLNQFGSRVGGAILQQAALDYIDVKLTSVRLSDMKNMTLDVRHGPVKYVDRKLVITKDTPQDADHILNTYFDVPFCKPKSYSPEKEYRFVFTLHDGNRIYPIKKKDLYLDLNLLTSP